MQTGQYFPRAFPRLAFVGGERRVRVWRDSHLSMIIGKASSFVLTAYPLDPV